MKKITLFIWAIFTIGLPMVSNGQFLTDNLLFTARLDGSQFSQTENSNAFGVATVSVNSTRDTMCVSVALANVTDSITSIGIYQGTLGSTGILINDLHPFLNGNRVATSLTGSLITPETITNFLNGQYSILVFTGGNTTPFIGGHFKLETDYSFYAVMSGGQEVPPTSSSAYGLAVIKLSMDSSDMKINMIAQGLSGQITGAHLHFGAPGVSGPVEVDLTSFVNENTIDATIDSGLFKIILDSLMMGDVYINVHTSVYPDGEIRGQVIKDEGIAFHTILSGASETPPVNTQAMGLAHVSLNNTLDTLSYQLITDGLSGPLTGAHFHFGAPGVAGPVLIDITDTSNAVLMGTIDSSVVADTLISDFLEGNIYVNVHTANHPNGEIRGQITRYNWEGFTLSMDGAQEVPQVVTSADGGGFVSIDPTATRLHFMVAAADLSDTATAVNFHVGLTNEEGPSIFNLTPYLNQFLDTASGKGSLFADGIWDSQSTQPLTIQDVNYFVNDSVYLNINTVFAPNGEVRGQVLHGTECFNLNTGIAVVASSPVNSLEVYPNPVKNNAVALIDVVKSSKIVIELFDITGKRLWKTNLTLPEGVFAQPIDLSGYHSGSYLISVRTDDQVVVKKIEKQ